MTRRDELRGQAIKVQEQQKTRINCFSISGSFRDSLIEQYLCSKLTESKDHGELKTFIFKNAYVYATYPIYPQDITRFCEKFQMDSQETDEGYIISF